MSEKVNKNYLKKLLDGEIPLSITFWIWFVFLTFTLSTFIEFNFQDNGYHRSQTTQNIDLMFYILTLIYTIFIFVAVIRSANKYNKSRIWSFLAKITVTINLVLSLFTAIDITKVYFFEDYAISAEIEMFKKELPIMVNSYTQLKNIEKNEKSLLYTYKLFRKDIQKKSMNSLKRFKKNVQNSLCEDDNTLRLLKKDYVLNYNYIDKDEQSIIKIITNKQACGPGIYDLDILKEILRRENSI